ncbi:MAG TPA: SRPBCC domain-containing protein [Nitrososphaerales archaeon]|nr:SRPBCC domain-containing protein [Nitrososphaerales archaeon]
MQLHLDGSTSIDAEKETIFNKLTDVKFIARTLPDAEDVNIVDSTTLEAKLKVRVAVVTSTLKLRMSIADTEPTSRARLMAEASGSGSHLAIRSTFELTGGRPTILNWSADAEITGVMAGLGSSILKGFATKKVGEIFAGITKALESEAA